MSIGSFLQEEIVNDKEKVLSFDSRLQLHKVWEKE
jgi:hypothetical protein